MDVQNTDTDALVGEAPQAEPVEPARSPCPIPDRVQVGAYLSEVQGLGAVDSAYEVDAWLWFKWCDPSLDPSQTVEFLNATDRWALRVTPQYALPEVLPDDRLYQVLRVEGRFSEDASLDRYPFDARIVGPVFEDAVHSVEVLAYERDPSEGVVVRPDLRVTGFNTGLSQFELLEAAYPTAFGDPRVEEAPRYARARVGVALHRPWGAATALFAPVALWLVFLAAAWAAPAGAVSAVAGAGLLTVLGGHLLRAEMPPGAVIADRVVSASDLATLAAVGVVAWAARQGPAEARHRGLLLRGVASLWVVALSAALFLAWGG